MKTDTELRNILTEYGLALLDLPEGEHMLREHDRDHWAYTNHVDKLQYVKQVERQLKGIAKELAKEKLSTKNYGRRH